MTIRPPPGRPATVSDHELMRRIQADDVRAFEALYDRYSARAFGLARVVCGGSQRAEDAVQDGFLCIWRSRTSYDPARGNPGAWLLTVIRYRSIDVMRHAGPEDRRRAFDGKLDYLPAPGSVAEDAEAHDQATRLRASLHALPELQRQVITLAYFGGLTHTQIAARLGLPAGTVKSRMRLGVQKLYDEIGSNPSSSAAETAVPESSQQR